MTGEPIACPIQILVHFNPVSPRLSTATCSAIITSRTSAACTCRARHSSFLAAVVITMCIARCFPELPAVPLASTPPTPRRPRMIRCICDFADSGQTRNEDSEHVQQHRSELRDLLNHLLEPAISINIGVGARRKRGLCRQPSPRPLSQREGGRRAPLPAGDGRLPRPLSRPVGGNKPRSSIFLHRHRRSGPGV